MKKLELNQMKNLEGGRFWGWGDWQSGPCEGGFQNQIRVYSVIWFSVDAETRTVAC